MKRTTADIMHEKEGEGMHVFTWHPNMPAKEVAKLLKSKISAHLSGGDLWVKEVEHFPADCMLKVNAICMPRSSNCEVRLYPRKQDIPQHAEPRNFIRKAQIGRGAWLVFLAGPDIQR